MLKYWFLMIGLIGLLLSGIATPATAQTDSQYTYYFLNLTDQEVDLYVNGEVAFLGIEARRSSAERVRDAAPQSFELYQANSNRAAEAALGAATVTPAGGGALAVVAYDRDGEVVIETIERNWQPVPVNLAHLKVVHLGEALPALSISGRNGDQLVENLAFGETAQAIIPGGNYQIVIADAEGNEIGAAAMPATPGTSVTLVIHGTDTARVYQVADPIDQQALLRFIHAGRISPPLDVYLNGELRFEGIGYSELTDYAILPPGDYSMAVYQTGETPAASTPLWEGTVALGTSYPVTAVALGEARLRVLPYIDNIQQIPENRARAKVIHAALNMPLLDVHEGTVRLVGSLEYPLNSPNFNIEAGQHTLTFSEAGGATYATLDSYAMQPHTFYTFVVIGNALIDESVDVLPLVWNWREAAFAE